ncbi:PREDICTED: uncharacterized protein LOC105974571 [Erythranthe guttata]|uniref:uncharacterized protein LOC105974571 n=1 Tax=Erythranthe guttata TaxID=4155 RepID=UPI00064DE8F2|nr:PREDICTED: uncharacterized protein LOC105974571 [Erythranthe guttata]|eukprot:XP_012855140.1 PREDICTED: uncharacterized protein LOC105974571 [Erythranthe guttata]
MDPKKIEINKQNKQNRDNLEFSYCLGRRSYAQKEYLMLQENPSAQISRADKWLAAHEHVDGTILERAKSKYDQVKAAANKRKSRSLGGEGCTEAYEDIDNDEIAEVFGKQKKGGVRAIGSYVSKKQLTHLSVAKSKIEQKDRALKDATDGKHEVLSRIDGLERLLLSVFSKLEKMEKTSRTPTSSSELGSNSNIGTLGVTQVPPSNTRAENPRIYLCDKSGKKNSNGACGDRWYI